MAKFNEDSRVKIPALLHLTRLGYKYLSLKNVTWDPRHNIFPGIFGAAMARLNPGMGSDDACRLLDDVHLELQAENLGRAFHQRLTARSGQRLVDLEDLDNNDWHVVTELPFVNGDEEFRPDITLLVNGMPLAFLEVKKPLNSGGVLEERKRMDRRHANTKFRHFFNLVQLMAFSNNMEYDDSEPEPVQGAFYAAPTYGEAHFNHFREERGSDLAALVGDVGEGIEDIILRDTNCVSIKGTPEFERNKRIDSPTNRLCTSLFSRARFAFLLRYAFAWLETDKGWQRHVMRYPQLFASMAIADKLSAGVRKGIVWHTQGSGKTALAFYNVRHLTDWFQKNGQVARFYFIEDRLDLLKQAQSEFALRGLVVRTIASRDEFVRDMRKTVAIENDRGLPEITVVNIQRFKDDPDVAAAQDYALNVQRVYFLDEVHRSYNPRGSFLANLEQSDRAAIKIGLTGTPLIGEQAPSKALFGDYIHKYYYNASIADGYTLRLIREEIATRYKMQMQQALENVRVQQGNIEKKQLYAHPRFCEAMLDYILEDFYRARITHGDNSIGGMVICDSADQARELHRQFLQFAESQIDPAATAANDDNVQASHAARPQLRYGQPKPTAQLILHDEGNNSFREEEVKAFKRGEIDLLFVYNMLLTGFDAPRLKKLYVGREIRQHNLLQALTRVNRRYRKFRYGYVVDFADIQSAFDRANKDYYDELTAELGDEMEHYSSLLKTEAEIRVDIDAIKEALFEFSMEDAELFSQQVAAIEDRDKLRAVVKALTTARELFNLIRLSGQDELRSLLDFGRLSQLQGEAQRALDALNLKAQMEDASDSSGLLNQALEDIVFRFEKLGEAELKLADELKDVLRRTREGLAGTLDPQDPKWLALKAELERLFKQKKLSEITQQEMQANIATLKYLESRVRSLNQDNANLAAKYGGDAKLLRVHKRLEERGIGASRVQLHAALSGIKQMADNAVLGNRQLLNNPDFFGKEVMPIVIGKFKEHPPVPDADSFRLINRLLVAEYLKESQGRLAF